MSEFMLVAKLMAGYLAGAFAIGIITLTLNGARIVRDKRNSNNSL